MEKVSSIEVSKSKQLEISALARTNGILVKKMTDYLLRLGLEKFKQDHADALNENRIIPIVPRKSDD